MNHEPPPLYRQLILPSYPRALSSAERQALRKAMRLRRNAVLPSARQMIALRIARCLKRYILRPGLRIAIYAAFDGEIDLAPTIALARLTHCILYGPIIVDAEQRRMEFVRTTAPTASRQNQFGIREPRDAPIRRIHPRRLDVILVPVVAYDAHGWRLGFGGGYYDRKLQFKRRSMPGNPLLIGIGYEFQRVPPVLASRWDVKLDFIVTERGLRACR